MRILVLTDRFPELSETFVLTEVRALEELGHELRIEALWPASAPNPDAADTPVTYLSEDSRAERLGALLWLAARHPVRAARDLAARSRWRPEEKPAPLRAIAPSVRRLSRGGEQHVHVHFAAEAALCGMRIAALAGVAYSVTAHAYEIFMSPSNLREKLERAAFATTGCEYNLAHLRAVAPDAQLHEIVMGVDAERFTRTRAHGSGRRVLAVGRLIEKKGFADLVHAAARLRDAGRPLHRVQIVGAGPLEAELAGLIHELDMGHAVKLLGARSSDEVRELLEQSDLLAMPCVVAANGDRDSMPVVVKEALAMEVPVVGTDEVGLPELVRPAWGTLVPPHDPAALARAIDTLLVMPPAERAAMGRAGRDYVLRIADVRRETAKLAELIASAGA